MGSDNDDDDDGVLPPPVGESQPQMVNDPPPPPQRSLVRLLAINVKQTFKLGDVRGGDGAVAATRIAVLIREGADLLAALRAGGEPGALISDAEDVVAAGRVLCALLLCARAVQTPLRSLHSA